MHDYMFDHERKLWWKQPGPWDREPDKRIWTDEYTGLPCIAQRNYCGAWCGYVGVRYGHHWFKKPYGNVDADVHGGLTYSDTREDEAVWWLGFDCSHAFDYVPGYPFRDLDAAIDSYCTLAYVQEQCAKLALQAHKAHMLSDDNVGYDPDPA
jgi:hypothetical protein